jgi:hypothetical protein
MTVIDLEAQLTQWNALADEWDELVARYRHELYRTPTIDVFIRAANSTSPRRHEALRYFGGLDRHGRERVVEALTVIRRRLKQMRKALDHPQLRARPSKYQWTPRSIRLPATLDECRAECRRTNPT